MNLTGLRCLIVEDVVILAELERRLLATCGAQVVIAGNLREARQLLGSEPFDVVIIDIGLPDGDGSDLIAPALSLVPPVPVIVVSGILDRGQDLELQAMGAIVLDKGGLEHLPHAVAAAARRTVAGPGIQATNSPASVRSCSEGGVVAHYALHHRLSTREHQVFELSFQGLGDKEIARQLHISHSTVRTYWRGIVTKTGCGGQRDVMRQFARHIARTLDASEQIEDAPKRVVGVPD